ncbi:hypothetical protein DYH09_02830 [bacterium CPR1]|nr:hypothetical protein [bacterium CPR1]
MRLELNVERQTLHPGDVVEGEVELTDYPKGIKVIVSLQGEEIVGANHLFRSYVLPLVEQMHSFTSTGEHSQRESFRFQLPERTPPSYASWDLRCQYFLKGRARPRILEEISRLHLTVLPPEDPFPESAGAELAVENGGIKLTGLLHASHLYTADSLRGELVLERGEGVESPLPERISFRFAAIEESKVSDYRKVLWVQSHDIEPAPQAELPLNGYFEFPIEETAPFSGEWSLFRVHYGFRVGLTPPGGGREERVSLPIQVYRAYEPLPEEPSKTGTGFSPPPQTEL